MDLAGLAKIGKMTHRRGSGADSTCNLQRKKVEASERSRWNAGSRNNLNQAIRLGRGLQSWPLALVNRFSARRNLAANLPASLYRCRASI